MATSDSRIRSLAQLIANDQLRKVTNKEFFTTGNTDSINLRGFRKELPSVNADGEIQLPSADQNLLMRVERLKTLGKDISPDLQKRKNQIISSSAKFLNQKMSDMELTENLQEEIQQAAINANKPSSDQENMGIGEKFLNFLGFQEPKPKPVSYEIPETGEELDSNSPILSREQILLEDYEQARLMIAQKGLPLEQEQAIVNQLNLALSEKLKGNQ